MNDAGELKPLNQDRVWVKCGYCRKDGLVPRSGTDIWDDCPECEGESGHWVDQFNVSVSNVAGSPAVILDPERTVCKHDLYADHEAKTIRCRKCGEPVEVRPV
jgi:ribosomal protein L37AE/L43A